MDGTAELKIEFSHLDRSDRTAVREWFDRYPFLSTNDFALILGYSPQHIRRLRRPPDHFTNIKQPKNTPVPEFTEIPENWNTREWLAKAVRTQGVLSVARMVKRDYRTIYDKIRRWGIPLRSYREATKSKHICCAKEWLHEHYVERNLSVRACGRLAGVSPDTITNWLIRFNFQVRTRDGAIVGEDPGMPTPEVHPQGEDDQKLY